MPDPTASESVAEHLARILGSVRPLSPQTVACEDALGCVLAQDVATQVSVPPFDNSAMDGFAVRHDDLALATARNPVRLTVIADLPAGTSLEPSVGPGQAARIMTGAPLPQGADAVVPFEQTDEGEASVAIAIAAVRGANIRPQGSDVRVGDVILERGRPLSSRHLAAAAAVGVTQLSVHPRPRVGIMATGSELRAVGMPLGTGLIHDSNTPMLCAAVREAGAAPVVLGPVSDRPAALLEALADGEGRVDVLVLAGGVGPGAYDVVRTTLASLGVRFSSVRMQPGKPQAFGVWRDGTPLFGLPGNPVAAYVPFEAFVRPRCRSCAACLLSGARPRRRSPRADGKDERTVSSTCPCASSAARTVSTGHGRLPLGGRSRSPV